MRRLSWLCPSKFFHLETRPLVQSNFFLTDDDGNHMESEADSAIALDRLSNLRIFEKVATPHLLDERRLESAKQANQISDLPVSRFQAGPHVSVEELPPEPRLPAIGQPHSEVSSIIQEGLRRAESMSPQGTLPSPPKSTTPRSAEDSPAFMPSFPAPASEVDVSPAFRASPSHSPSPSSTHQSPQHFAPTLTTVKCVPCKSADSEE